jgi:hypothetical protein
VTYQFVKHGYNQSARPFPFLTLDACCVLVIHRLLPALFCRLWITFCDAFDLADVVFKNIPVGVKQSHGFQFIFFLHSLEYVDSRVFEPVVFCFESNFISRLMPSLLSMKPPSFADPFPVHCPDGHQLWLPASPFIS